MQGGFSYQDSVFTRATQAARQPGSSFKPFVYAAALDSRFTPATMVVDAPIMVNTPQGLWTPKNSHDKFFGPAPLRTGIEQSRNLMTIRIAKEVGMDTIAGYAERFGVYDQMQPLLANSLGAQESTLFKMVASYAMFANGGERVEPTLVDRVQDRYGATIYRHDARTCVDCGMDNLPQGAGLTITTNRERVMNAITAYQLTSMMEGVIQRGTATNVQLPVPVAGKTGTTNEAKDVWFIGFTSNVVAGCYMGYDNPRGLGPKAFGGTLWDQQTIRQRLSMLDAKTRAARQFMYHCAWSVTQGHDIVQEVSMLKALTGELVNEVVQTCQQFHGGMGFIRETAIERLWRDARVLAIGGGATEVMLEEVAKRY
jgi:penicillin-binding protein 1A